MTPQETSNCQPQRVGVIGSGDLLGHWSICKQLNIKMKTENYEHEDLIPECIEIIKTEQRASVSLLQRRLRLGYIRAASIMDELEKRGIVGPEKGAEPRDILIR